jgi:pimeloyl-ACP methyl ester carboxylesterase
MDSYADCWWTSPDGLRLYARDYPPTSGPERLPVVCLHGLTRSSRDFEEVAPWIAARGRRVLALDIRGRGRSAWDPTPTNYHPGTYAVDVAGMLDSLGVACAVFVGTSMGGLITMIMSAARPELVSAAILNDVGPELSPIGLKRIAALSASDPVETWADAAAYARRTNGLAFPGYTDEDWQRFASRLFVEDAAGRPVLNYDPDIMAPIRAAGPNALAPDLWPLFAAFVSDRRTLLVRGETSDLLAPETARRMCEHDGMTCVEAPGVGHAPMLTEPVARRAMQTFLDEVA